MTAGSRAGNKEPLQAAAADPARQRLETTRPFANPYGSPGGMCSTQPQVLFTEHPVPWVSVW